MTTPSTTPIDPDQLLNTEQAGRLLGLSPYWISAHLAELPHIRAGRRVIRFRRSDLQRWADNHAQNQE
jgi:predicted DNA-binding transcriptional regulator AlpA